MPYKIYKKLNENGDIEELPLDGGVDLSEEQISFIKNEYLKSLNELHLENISRRISSGIFYSLTDETITISGTKTTEGTFIQSLGYCECKANTQYTSKVFNDPSLDTAYIAVDVVDSSKQWIATYFPTPSVSFTTPSNAAFFQIRVGVESTEKINKVFPVLIKEGTEIPEEFSKFYGDILHQVDLDNHNDNTTTAHGSLLKFIDNQKEIVYKNASESVNELKLLNTKPITQNGVTWYVKDNCLYSQGAPGNKASITLTLDEPFSIPYTNPLVYTGKVFGYTSGIYSSVLMDTNDPRPTVVYYFPNNGDTFSTQGYSVSSLYISNLKPSTTGDEWKVLKFSLVKGTQPEEFPGVHWNEITHEDDLKNLNYYKITSNLTGTDLNTIVEAGNYGIASDCTNLPNGATDGTLFVGLDAHQLFIDSSDLMYTRSKVDENWSEWGKVIIAKDNAISVDTINGATKGNTLVKQDKTNGNIYFGSELQKSIIKTKEARPKAHVNGDNTQEVDVALLSDIPTNNNQLTNGAEYINKDVNNLTNYTLATNTASSIEMSIDNSTYVVSLKLKNADGTQLGETQTIDLPLESVVVNGAYDSTTKEVVLTLDNGSEIRFSVADLVSGLQSEITTTNKLSSDLVDDTNSTNKFVTSSEKETWNNKANYSDLSSYLPLSGGTITPNKTGNFNEGIYIEDASNGWSTLGLGSKDKTDLIGLTHNKAQGKATISRKVSDVQFDINVPAKNGTMALTSDCPTQQEKEFLTDEYEKSKNLAINTLNNFVLTNNFGGQLVYKRNIGDSNKICVTLNTTNLVDTSSGSGALFRYKKIDGTVGYILAGFYGGTGTNSTVQENIDELYLENHAGATGTINWLQVENGETFTGYQSYNPSQHITNNQANFLIDEHNKEKNLFDGELLDGAYSFVDGVYYYGTTYKCNKNLISVEEGKKITLSLTGNYTTYASGFVFYKNGTYVGSASGTLTAVVPTGANQVAFDIHNDDNPVNVSNIQLEYGDATSYQSYNSSSHITNEQADLLKSETEKSYNLLNPDSSVVHNSNTTSSYDFQNNSVLVTKSNQQIGSAGFELTSPITLEVGETYTVSIFYDKSTIVGEAYLVFYLYHPDNTYIDFSIDKANNFKYYTFTNTSSLSFYRYSFDIGAEITVNTNFKIMITKGSSQPTSYLPYYGQIVHEKDYLNNIEQICSSGDTSIRNDILSKPFNQFKEIVIAATFKDWENEDITTIPSVLLGIENLKICSGDKNSNYIVIRPNSSNKNLNITKNVGHIQWLNIWGVK